MVGVNEKDLVNAAHGDRDKWLSLWKIAYRLAVDLNCFTGSEVPFDVPKNRGNLNVGDLVAWAKSVAAPAEGQPKQVFESNQRNVALLSRFVKTIELRMTPEDKAVVL
jgi:hypothetical protein